MAAVGEVSSFDAAPLQVQGWIRYGLQKVRILVTVRQGGGSKSHVQIDSWSGDISGGSGAAEKLVVALGSHVIARQKVARKILPSMFALWITGAVLIAFKLYSCAQAP